MKEIIIKYLDKQYRLTLNTYANHMLYDRVDKENVGLKTVFNMIVKLFDITLGEIEPIFDEWCEEKSIDMNNRIVDIKYKVYQETGIEVDSSNYLNKMLELDEEDWEYGPD